MRLFIFIFFAICLWPGSFQARTLYKTGETVDSYFSPTRMCANKAMKKLYVSLSTACRIAVVDAKTRQLEKSIPIPFNPGGIAYSTGMKTLVIADRQPEGHVYLLSPGNEKIQQRFRAGHTPDALVLTPDEEMVFVANRFSHTVSVIDLVHRKVVKHIPVEREPVAVAVSGDGTMIAVANNLPLASADKKVISAKLTLIDRKTLEVIKDIELTNGSHSIRGVAFSGDGKFLYASHIVSNNHLPTTQLAHGWMNTNALSVIDVESREYFTTVLLDNFDRGAANPSGMDLSDDGKQLYIALSGVHECCVIDLVDLHKKLAAAQSGNFSGMAISHFHEIPRDFRFLYGLKKRIPLEGKSPRHIFVFRNGVFVSSYFSGGLDYLPGAGKSGDHEFISLGNQPEMGPVRRGELLFSDADLCFQQWQSCISCHPGGRSDGLNWDLLNDGMGNPKNTKSLLNAHATPPSMITGVRENAEVAVRAGIKFIQFSDFQESDARDIDAYLKSLKPVPGPFLVNGALSGKAQKGKAVFEKAGCLECHAGEYFTDGKMHDVGTGIVPHRNAKFDTPSLAESWRTAPYLYDGRAKTMKAVFTQFNAGDKHGKTSTLTGEELDNLVEYILSL